MKTFKTILKVLVLAIALTLGSAASLPAQYRVESMRVIPAPAGDVWPYVNNLKEWERWSPWRANDPTVQNSYEGAASGAGAVMRWKSEKSGSGKISIADTFAPRNVRYDLHFDDWGSDATGEITLENQGESTLVKWTMTGERSFVEKVFWMVLRVEKAITKDFSLGLSLLEKTVTSPPPVPA